MVKVYLWPEFSGPDDGDGGVRRVVDAQRKYLPRCGVEVVASPDTADLLAVHIAAKSDILGRNLDKPLVAHSHGLYWSEMEWPRWALKANVECMETIRQSDAVTAPSEWVAQSIRRHTLRDVTTIGHGVDLGEFATRSAHGPDKGFVLWNKTRTDPVCDPEALSELARRASDVPFVTTYGVTDLPNVAATGRLSYDKAKKVIQDAAVYLCTTRETFGIGTIEAMAAEVPVLGWRWGGQADIIEHGVTGWLSRPGDFDDLLTGLRYCLEHRAEMGKAARAAVRDRYQWKTVMTAYADLYGRIVEDWKTPRPKVSVIVPAYNLAEYLPATLDSVKAQTEHDFECIIVDDASPDSSGQIADSYAAEDPRFKVIHNETNQYLSGALNTGIAASSGRFIIPVDADNLLPPDTLKVLSTALASDRSIHIAYGNVEFMEPDGRRWHSGWPMSFTPEFQVMRRRADGGPSNMVPSTSMFKRAVWAQTGGYRRRYRNGEDADFWTRATSYGFRAKMVTEADALIYRNRPDSMSRVEGYLDWTAWLPWAKNADISPPAGFPAMDIDQHPISSFDPPQIAVIIPVGPDHRHLFMDAVDSVEAQTFRQTEIIVVNDSGSPLDYVPSWVKVIETDARDVAVARNLGIAQSSAKLFVPLDADDSLEPGALMTLLWAYRMHDKYVYSDWYEVWSGQEPKSWATEDYDANLLLTKGCLHAVTALYRRADWEKVGGFSVGISWEDWDFQLKLAEAGVCGIRIAEPLFTYRKDTGVRRETAYADFDKGKAQMRGRWGDFFDGREILMGCGCSGSGQASSPPVQQPAGVELPSSSAGYEIVEYVGGKAGAVLYTGQISGQVYRFSSLETENKRYVLKDDVPWFEAHSDFRIRVPEAALA